MKKTDLVSKIEKLKGKVVVDNNIKNLCDQVSRLSENLAKLMESNEKLSSQFIVVKKVNTLLETCNGITEKSSKSRVLGEIILKSLVSLMKFWIII